VSPFSLSDQLTPTPKPVLRPARKTVFLAASASPLVALILWFPRPSPTTQERNGHEREIAGGAEACMAYMVSAARSRS